MIYLLISALMRITSLRSAPPSEPAARPAFVTAQDQLWSRNLRDEANLPTFDELFSAADATEAQIRTEITSIDAHLTSYRVVERAGSMRGPEGDFEATGWFDGAALRKIEFRKGGETWRQTVTYFFAGDRPIARFNEREQFAGVLPSRYAPVASRSRDEQILLEPPTGWDSDDAAIQAEMQMLRALLREPWACRLTHLCGAR
jgi:hypothetical protein